MRALITGGSGFVGRHLVKRLEKPIVVGRNAERIAALLPGAEARGWDPARPLDPELFADADTVFHLAGESIFGGRWNAVKKEKIRASRVRGTRTLVEALAKSNTRPKALISSSAIGYYGSQGDEILREDSAAGEDFLAQVCKEWEREAYKAEALGIRVVTVRLGVVLGADGGALAQMLPPFRLGVGGRLGSGKQYLSWIHINDLVGMMLHAAATPELHGPINGVAPGSVTNREFSATLARLLHRPALLPVPGPLLRLALGELAGVLLGSQRVIPAKSQAHGFRFTYPELGGALRNLLNAA